MLKSCDLWAGLAPGRLSFGLVGVLSSLSFRVDHVLCTMKDLKLSEDAFDGAKRALSGHISIADLFSSWGRKGLWPYLYIMAQTKRGSIRTGFSDPTSQNGRHLGIEYRCVFERSVDLMMCSPIDYNTIPWDKNKVVIEVLQLTLPLDPWEYFFTAEDKKWQFAEAHLAESSTEHQKNSLILKKMLCPPTSWCSNETSK